MLYYIASPVHHRCLYANNWINRICELFLNLLFNCYGVYPFFFWEQYVFRSDPHCFFILLISIR